MRVYLIYGVMDQYTQSQSNCYGQYDIFKSGKTIDSLSYVLWGFTDKKKIRDKFFKERPVKNRYYEKIVTMEESQYSTFMMDHFRYELLPIAFDIRENIGTRSGYLRYNSEFGIARKASISKEEKPFFQFRISTRAEYDFISHNLGEICSMYKSIFFKKHADELPLDSSIFTEPVRSFLNRRSYMADVYSYHPYMNQYLKANPEEDAKYKYWLEKGMNDSDYFEDEFSMLKVYYLTYKEMIF